MAQAPRDQNLVPTILGTSSADGTTPLVVKASPTTHAINVSDGTTGTDLSGDIAARDQNFVPVWLAVSEIDGTTPVPVYVDASGNLLVDSN